jgi:hypothetical protein
MFVKVFFEDKEMYAPYRGGSFNLYLAFMSQETARFLEKKLEEDENLRFYFEPENKYTNEEGWITLSNFFEEFYEKYPFMKKYEERINPPEKEYVNPLYEESEEVQ